MLLLIISATYAYFSVTITGNGSKTMITANTPKKHSLSVSTLYDDIHIHVDNEDMKLANIGSYYGAVNDNRYEKTKEEGTHNIIEVSSKGMENIRYSCSGNIKVTLETKEGSMGSVLEKEDVLLYLKGLGLDETLDLSTLKVNNTKIYKTSFEIDGDSSDYLSAIVELVNKESYQNYLTNKILNIKIEAENMVCRENGTYKYMVKLNKSIREMQNGKEVNKGTVSQFYDDEGMYQKIQNIYLVDYIDTSKAIKTWELGDKDRGTKSNEVMGWLETTADIEDSYDLYIGSNGPMRAPTDMTYAFYNFTNLKKISGDALDTSEVTSMANLFNSNTNLADIAALTNWNVQNVTNMSNLFNECRSLTNLVPLSDWNTHNLLTMSGMFYNGYVTRDITPLSKWDVSKVKNMDSMFASYISSNNSVYDLTPLQNWDTSSVIYMNSMFKGAKEIIDISSLQKWDTSNVIDMSSMFSSNSITDLSPIKNWNILKVTNMYNMFAGTLIQDLTPIKDWNVSQVVNMSGMFSSTLIEDLTPLSKWSVSGVTNMSSMFYSCYDLYDISPLANWKVSNVTNMAGMFEGYLGMHITDINVLSNWDVSKVTNMSEMFSNTQISDLTPISKWDVSKVTSMYRMFNGTPISDLSPLKDWKISKVTNMSEMFQNCKNIENLNGLQNWDTSNVTNMAAIFINCNKLNDISAIKNWNVSNVTKSLGTWGGIFENCTSLIKVDLSNWKMPKLIDVARMFAGCTNLIELKLPQASYNNIKEISNYSGLFGGQYTNIYGSIGTTASVPNNITVYTESSQIEWIKARLQEALGENNNSTVIVY